MSISENVSILHDLNQLSQDRLQCMFVLDKDMCPSDLADGLTALLHIDNDVSLASKSNLVPPSAEDNVNNAEKEHTCCKTHYTDLAIVISEEYLSKSSTMPSSDEITSSQPLDRKRVGKDEDELVASTDSVSKGSDNEVKEASYYPVPLPNPLKLVSAIKGSREKLGTPSQKLTVTWAPDVYDPTPTAASHVVTNKKQRYRSDNKKNRKNKQKGASKPTKGKDKKQVRKYGGSSNRCYKTPEDDYRVVLHDEPFVDLGDFEVGSPESYCGGSFLKKSVTKMHLSVAEAT